MEIQTPSMEAPVTRVLFLPVGFEGKKVTVGKHVYFSRGLKQVLGFPRKEVFRGWFSFCKKPAFNLTVNPNRQLIQYHMMN